MKLLKLNSIKNKLVTLVAVTCGVALFVSCCAFVGSEIVQVRSAKVKQFTTLAEVLASNSSAAVSFGQADACEELLISLSTLPTVEYASLLDDEGETLADYSKSGATLSVDKALTQSSGHHFSQKGFLDIVVPVEEDGERLGTLFLHANMDDMWEQVSRDVKTAGTILVISLGVAVMIALRLQNLICKPILNLAHTADQISANGNYSVRVATDSSDEIGTLYACFNQMLDEIEKGEASLREAYDGLEDKVNERTEELSVAHEKLKEEFVEREKLNKHMVDLSHKAGKAEIATGVLHNVGNVLNSINVSAGLVDETLRFSKIASLKRATDMLASQDDLPTFIESSERGKALPGYLCKLTDRLQEEHTLALEELSTLNEHLEHVKTIVSMQQSYAGVSGLEVDVSLPDLIDDAEVLNASSLAKHHVDVIRDFEELPRVKVQKQKLLQVLVNLLKNAKDAMIEGRTEGRELKIRIYRTEQDRLVIDITDNGVGISADNLTNIFSHGFTTKENGHGFGLHSCGNAAKEMRGSLAVHSSGIGKGATFTLELPYQPVETAEALV